MMHCHVYELGGSFDIAYVATEEVVKDQRPNCDSERLNVLDGVRDAMVRVAQTRCSGTEYW